jgi:hypothetical protein
LKPEDFILEIMLEHIGICTVISRSKLQAIPPIKFNSDMMEWVVMAAMNDQECHEAYNVAREGNPSAHIEYLYGALYYTGRR